MTLSNRHIVLVIGGGIAAYKSLELARELTKRGAVVRSVLTSGGAKFVTALTLGGLTGEKVYADLFSLTEEAEMGHIRLSREADLIAVVPATADLMARMVAGIADDLATAVLLATDKPVMIAPSMNVQMWNHPATQRNVARLREDGVLYIQPGEGDLACGETGAGRLADIDEILANIEHFFNSGTGAANAPLAGRRALITSGPTHEPIDPVRYIANRSSGKQGHAIARALADLGAETILVSGPTNCPDPLGVKVVRVETARDMLAACQDALPADIAVCAAAVADWHVEGLTDRKIKKDGGAPPTLSLGENPDILATLSSRNDRRPELVVGFAAETNDVISHAQAKLKRKGCDWIVANDVSPETGIMGGDHNCVHLITATGVDSWEQQSKGDVARKLADRISSHLANNTASR